MLTIPRLVRPPQRQVQQAAVVVAYRIGGGGGGSEGEWVGVQQKVAGGHAQAHQFSV